MSEEGNTVDVCLINKKSPKRTLYLRVQSPSDMYTMKQKMILFFAKQVQPSIAGFRLVREGPPEDDSDDTITDNYFDDKYNDQDAVTIFKRIKEIYRKDNNENPLIYFRVIKLNE